MVDLTCLSLAGFALSGPRLQSRSRAPVRVLSSVCYVYAQEQHSKSAFHSDVKIGARLHHALERSVDGPHCRRATPAIGTVLCGHFLEACAAATSSFVSFESLYLSGAGGGATAVHRIVRGCARVCARTRTAAQGCYHGTKSSGHVRLRLLRAPTGHPAMKGWDGWARALLGAISWLCWGAPMPVSARAVGV